MGLVFTHKFCCKHTAFRWEQAAEQSCAPEPFVSRFVTEEFNCDPVSRGKSSHRVWGTRFFSRLRKSIRAPGLDLECLPGGECQGRHCPNKSSLLGRCLRINPAVCCAWRQKSTDVFSSKEQTLQGWHCQSQRVIGDFSSLLAGDGFPSPSSDTVEVSALLKGGGCLSPAPMGGFWVEDPPQQDPTSFLEFLSAADLGDP